MRVAACEPSHEVRREAEEHPRVPAQGSREPGWRLVGCAQQQGTQPGLFPLWEFCSFWLAKRGCSAGSSFPALSLVVLQFAKLQV